MILPDSTQKTTDDDWQINDMDLRVSSRCPDLYNNGRQQVEIELYVKPSENGKVVDLTPSEIARLKIVKYNNENEEVPWDSNADEGYTWVASREYKGYAYYDRCNLTVAKNEVKKEGQYIRLYLSCKNVPANQKEKFAIMVTGDNQMKYCTNGKSWYSDGEPNNLQKYDRPIEITVHAPPQ